jgi:hypothetical protein
MADPKQLASLLSEEEELRRFNAAQGEQPWYSKALPMEGRATLLPFRDTMEGSVFNKRELALPGILAGALNAFTSPARALTGSDPTFKPGEEAANMALNTFGGGIATGKALTNPTGVGGTDLALNAWHGTPHEIKGNFDISKVGTGEGAQSYGHGMYFGEARGTGEQYRDTLGFIGAKDKAGEIYGKDGISFFFENALEQSGVPAGAAKSQAQLWTDKFVKGETINNPIANQVIESKGLQSNKIGNLYKVDIPDAAIPMMLNWDKPLSQQPKEIQTWLSDPYNPYKKQLLQKDSGGNEPYGRDIYNRLANLMSEGKGWDVGNKNASQELSSFGITGIRYLDEGSRGTGKGTSNFVVFDPSTVKILEKNDVPVTRKELLQQEFDKLDK